MSQIDEIAPVAPEKMVVQYCFQIFNPLIIINHLAGRQVQIYFPAYDFAENNLVLWNDAALISPLHQQAVFTAYPASCRCIKNPLYLIGQS